MRRSLLPPILVAVAAAVPAVAMAAPHKYVTKNDVVTATVHKTGVEGTKLVYKGTVHSKVFGTGQVTEKVFSLGKKGTFVVKYKYGYVHGSSTATIKAKPEGGVDVTGTYKLESGTGRYKYVTGSGTYTGTGSADIMTATFKQTGKVKY